MAIITGKMFAKPTSIHVPNIVSITINPIAFTFWTNTFIN